MTREERCELAIERGFTYNSETGKIYSRFNNEIKFKERYIRMKLTLNKKQYFLSAHQFAWYFIYKECVEEIDHINGNRYDNRICNLRSVTRQQNQWNRKTAKGYTWHKNNKKWESAIKVNKKRIYLGSFNTEEEARNAYLQAKEIYHKI
jgi:hypothetical protein